jgi:NADH dehydrogenase (ubiquinone) Fe-S protein 3
MAFSHPICSTSIAGVVTMIPQWIKQVQWEHGQPTFVVDPQDLPQVLTFLKHHTMTQVEACMDITAVDYPEQEARFEVVYIMLSTHWNARLKVKAVGVSEDTPVPSITNLYNSANWYEREVWDMYGVFFKNHPDLRRILTDYGFQGHPLRKDFPLSGYVEARYDDTEKRVVLEPIQLGQEFRAFDFQTPWIDEPKSN